MPPVEVPPLRPPGPDPIQPEPSPFWPRHLVDLYLRPGRFFREQLALGHTPYALLVTWALGIDFAIGQIGLRIAQSRAAGEAHPPAGVEQAFGTWPEAWAFALAVGALAGAFYWYVGGFWCWLRIHWSGALSPDRRQARLLLLYSSFVFAGPSVAVFAADTLLYPTPVAAFERDFLYGTVVLAFVFWSMVTTYRGVLALFPVARWRARLWFLVLPALFQLLLIAFGASVLAEGG